MKKTKAEKRLADSRRVLELDKKEVYRQETRDNHQITSSSVSANDSSLVGNNPIHSASRLHSQTQSIYIYPVHFIRRDLTKTLILCILAISLELGLFIALEKPGLLPF